MSKFPKGTQVYIVKKVDDSDIYWAPEMDRYVGDGKPYTVEACASSGAKLSNSWWFPWGSLKEVGTQPSQAPSSLIQTRQELRRLLHGS